jgi:dolichol-phosphate mannosyltransferase
MKVSIVIPVYYNEDNLIPLYEDIKTKYIDVIDYDYELVMVNDGSGDGSKEVLKEIAGRDKNVRVISLSRNFGSHAAILCGLAHSTGDCAVVKTADLQEPSELLHEMVASWKAGNNVVLAVREGRDESRQTIAFANLYYSLVRKLALPTMPKKGFDVYLVDRKVIDVLNSLDEKNSALTGQILWSGFRTGIIYYDRKAREIGKSRWTLKKKIRLVADTLFGFSTVPIRILEIVGLVVFIVGIIWAFVVLLARIEGRVPVSGYTTLVILNLVSFGILMLSMGILGEYLWRTFDASRGRPPYIVEDEQISDYKEV